MVDFKSKKSYAVSDLVDIVRLLRAPGGCPWDREQDHHSLRRNLLEEAYEAAEAIDEENPVHLQEELGDVLLQVVMHAQMEQEQGGFTLDDVADGICKKLIYRHPHVFGNECVADSGEVLQNWDVLKRSEKGQQTTAEAVEAVARSLPSLWRAEKIQKKAAKAGFDWPDISGAFEKLTEETDELREAVHSGTNIEEELGDLLFSAVNVARFVRADPEAALASACDKFSRRFRLVEEAAQQQAVPMQEMTVAQLDVLWDAAKKMA